MLSDSSVALTWGRTSTPSFPSSLEPPLWSSHGATETRGWRARRVLLLLLLPEQWPPRDHVPSAGGLRPAGHGAGAAHPQLWRAGCHVLRAGGRCQLLTFLYSFISADFCQIRPMHLTLFQGQIYIGQDDYSSSIYQSYIILYYIILSSKSLRLLEIFGNIYIRFYCHF